MTDNTRKKLVESYFMKRPRPDYLVEICIAAFGLIVSILGTMKKETSYNESGERTKYITSEGWQIIVFGIILIGVAILVARYKYQAVIDYDKREKATDQQMDEWLEKDKDMVLKESLQALDMESDDANAWPLMIDGTLPDAKKAVGDDKVLRYSVHSILVFYLTEQHVATFKCKLDMALGCIVEQSTREFPYKDITNLETVTRNKSMQFASDRITAIDGEQEFSLYTSGSNKISVYYLFNKSSASDEDYILMPSDAETTIKAIRKKLKEYKDRLVPGAEFNMSI